MQRSIGVTVSVIFVFIGSGLTLLLGGLMAVALLLTPQTPPQPPFMKYFLAVTVCMEAAFAIWGIASGVGLLLLKQWARISMIVYCCILLFFTLPGMVFVWFLPFPPPPGSPDNMAVVIKIAMSAFYGIFVAIAVAWLYFFNRKNVKDQFSPPAASEDPSAPQAAQPTKRPLSISIIGWILVVTGVLALPTPLLHAPMFFLGFLVTGWGAGLFMLTWCVVQGIAGIGLLRLRSWGRLLAIGVFSFGLVNVAAIALIPGNLARFQQVNTETQARMQARMGLPTAGVPTPFTPEMMRSFMWFGAISGGLFVAIQLWFVVTRKDAFTEAADFHALSP
jgi:hypothetical protein